MTWAFLVDPLAKLYVVSFNLITIVVYVLNEHLTEIGTPTSLQTLGKKEKEGGC